MWSEGDGGRIKRYYIPHRELATRIGGICQVGKLTRIRLFGNCLGGDDLLLLLLMVTSGLLSNPDTITCFMAMLSDIVYRLSSSRSRRIPASLQSAIVTWMVNGIGLRGREEEQINNLISKHNF